MKIDLPFEKQDYFMLRNSVVAFVISLLVAGGSYFAVSFAMQSARAGAASAQNTFDQVSQSVQQIAQEESTVVRYIGRYREMEQEGVVSDEDRLAFLETFGEIRNANDLFAVNIQMGEQVANPLAYDPNDLNPGEPVALRFTPVEIGMPLLHEEDLTRLLDELLVGNGLILPIRCSMRVNNLSQVSFTQLGEHLQSDCVLQMYTYDLNPPVPVNEY